MLLFTSVLCVVETVSESSKLLIVIDRCRSVYCDACCADDWNVAELFCVDRSCTLVVVLVEPLSLLLAPMLNRPRLIPPPPELEVLVWLLRTWLSELESLLVACWCTAEV